MIRLFRQYISPRKTIFILGEGLLIFLAVSLASHFLLDGDTNVLTMLGSIWHKVLLITLVAQLSLYFNDLYESEKSASYIDLAARLIQAIGITSIALAIIYILWPDMIIGRWIFFVSLVFLLLFLVSWRILYAIAISKKLLAERAIMIGSDELARDIMNQIETRKDLSYNISSIIAHNHRPAADEKLNGIPLHVGFDNIFDVAVAENIKSIIVALDEKRGIFPVEQLLKCKVHGINIIDGESFFERVTGKLLVERINPSWLIFSDGFSKPKTSRVLKRSVGFLGSAVSLVLLSPLLLTVAVAQGVTQALHGHSWFQWQLEMRGLFVIEGPHRTVTAAIKVMDFMDMPAPGAAPEKIDPEKDIPLLKPTDSLEQALRMFDTGGHERLPVVDPADHMRIIAWASQIRALSYFNRALVAASEEEHR